MLPVVISHAGEVCFGTPNHNLEMKRGFVPEEMQTMESPSPMVFLLGVGSNLRMQPNITSQIIRVGEPILLSAPGPAMVKNFLIASIIGHNNKDKNDVSPIN